MALCTRRAATDESTPPLNPQIARPPPRRSEIMRVDDSMKEDMVQSRRQPQTRVRKFSRISRP